MANWLTDRNWREQAACASVDPELFFPPDGSRVIARKATAICATCPVRIDCLYHAISTPEKSGVWGGLTEKERRSLRRDFLTS